MVGKAKMGFVVILKILGEFRTAKFLSQCADCAYKSTKNLNYDILDLMD